MILWCRTPECRASDLELHWKTSSQHEGEMEKHLCSLCVGRGLAVRVRCSSLVRGRAGRDGTKIGRKVHPSQSQPMGSHRRRGLTNAERLRQDDAQLQVVGCCHGRGLTMGFRDVDATKAVHELPARTNACRWAVERWANKSHGFFALEREFISSAWQLLVLAPKTIKVFWCGWVLAGKGRLLQLPATKTHSCNMVPPPVVPNVSICNGSSASSTICNVS